MRRIIFSVALLVCASAGDIVAQTPKSTPARFVRVVAVDVSSSMKGPNLEAAKREIQENASQLPPSLQYPLVIIPFHSAVDRVHRFTDPVAVKTFLSQLQANGGTSIASGLRAAIKELKPYQNVRHVCVMLYTDGEDSDQKTIALEEEQLDHLFAERNKQGLKQTVVFCKRWQNANAGLVSKISKRGNARVVDAGELRVVPITLVPDFKVIDVQWAAGKPTLAVKIQGHIDVRGTPVQGGIAPLDVQCRTPGAQGDTKIALKPGTTNTWSIQLPIDVRKVTTTNTTELEFAISEPREILQKDSLVLPILPIDVVRLTVKIPQQKVHSKVTASLSQTVAPRWLDAPAKRLAVPVKLSIHVTSDPDAKWLHPLTFRIGTDAGNSIIAGPSTVTLSGPGMASVDLTVAATQMNKLIPLSLTVSPDKLPVAHTIEPPKLSVNHEIKPPPPVSTIIRGRVNSITVPIWTDLRVGTAAFTASVDVDVQGPLAKGTTIVLQCPGTVRRINIEPSTIHTGTQTLVLRVEAIMRPSPHHTNLSFRVDPPAPQGAVNIQSAGSWQMSVAGPAAPQLVLANGSSVPQVFKVMVSDTADTATLNASPVICGIQDAKACEGIKANIHSSGLLHLQNAGSVQLFRPTAIRLSIPERASRSFFKDSRFDGELVVSPSPSTVPVRTSKQRIIVWIEAPFKRLLFYLAAALCSLLSLYFLIRILTRFTSVDYAAGNPEDPSLQ